MTGIVWLASYPKSGNTWLRAFLMNFLDPGKRPVDINQLG
ncbi:MAG: sulfotransferase, partial [Acidobacteriota bacterium]